MRPIRVTLALAVFGWFGLVEGISRAGESGWHGGTSTKLLAKGKDKKEDTKDKKEDKKDKTKEKRKKEKGEGTRRAQPVKESVREITGVLAVAVGPDGAALVTMTSANGKVYALDLPDGALPKAQKLAGKNVCAKGRVRNRNGQFLLDRIQSCRPVADEPTVPEAAPKAVPEPVFPEGE